MLPHIAGIDSMIAEPSWDGSDFSIDFRVRTLNGAIPLTFAFLSFAILVLTWSVKCVNKTVNRRTRQRQVHTIGSSVAIASASRDLMLEAENAVIRSKVKEQGILWPGAYKALGMLKEKGSDRLISNGKPTRSLALPDDGQMNDSRWWMQWWKAPREKMKKQSGLSGSGERSRRRGRAWIWKGLGRKLVKQGKKDFIQALIAWGVVALLLFKAYSMKNAHTAWKWVTAIAWTYFTLLLEMRQYTALLHRSPFRPQAYDRLTFHTAPFMIAMVVISMLELRSVILQYAHDKQLLGPQSLMTVLSIVILLMEILTPRPSNFLRKSAILAERARPASEMIHKSRNGSTSSDGNNVDVEGEGDPLLPHSQSLFSGSNDDSDLDLDEEDALLAVSDLVDASYSITDLKQQERATGVRPPPEIGASIFSLATFTYIGSFLFKYARIPATFDDVPDLRADDKSASVILEFRAACKTYPIWLHWRSQSGMQRRPSIFLQICWYFWPQLLTMLTWAFIKPFLVVLLPLFVNLILQWTTARQHGADAKVHVALFYITGLFCAQMLTAMTNLQAVHIGRRLCTRAKALVIAEVFTKSLRRKDLAGKALVQREEDTTDAKAAANGQEEKGPASAGRIQNLVSVDASQIAEVFAYIHFFFPEGPVTIIVASAMLFKLIGFSAFAAVGTILCLIPFHATVARLFMHYQNQTVNAADARLTLTTEVFQAIKVLKYFAWEKKFAEKLTDKREVELRALRKRAIVFTLGAAAEFGVPVLIALVTFLFHTKILRQPLDASTAFTSLSVFNIIRAPLEQLTDMASQLIAAIVSCTRVDALLEEEETTKYAMIAGPSTASEPKIGFVNAAFTWADADSALDDTNIFKLKNLNLDFLVDGLNLVVGPVGSGKSSLLYALLSEMNLLQGRCFLPSPLVREAGIDPGKELTNTVAFCPQTPWLLNDTIRNNILFGSAYNAERYKHVLYACALFPDLETLEFGDRTAVGEKGTVLSGGQKARISLARAIYSSAKVILLDDVLSAVDAHTARHLYNNCLTSEELMRGRTRLLVTHTLHLTLPRADNITALANGNVVFDGPALDYVVASGLNTPGLATGQDFSGLTLRENDEDNRSDLARVAPPAAEQALNRALPHSDECAKNLDPLLSSGGNIEGVTTGAVRLGVYTFYSKAFGSFPVIISLIAVIFFTETVAVGTSWALRLWASSFDDMIRGVGFSFSAGKEEAFYATYKEIIDKAPDIYLKRYVALAVLSMFLYGVRVYCFIFRGTLASRIIYNSVIKTLLAAPMRFYDQTPTGRIMNRFSSDMETIDQHVPQGLMWLTLEIFGISATIVAIAIALPAFFIAGVFLSVVYGLLGWLYIASSRQLKRIEAITRSPVYSLVGESLMGVTSIRAYSDSARFTAKLFDLIDDTNRPFFVLWLTNRWLSLRSSLGGACFTCATGLFIVFSPKVSASLAGFALTYAILMDHHLFWIVRHYAATQINMNAVERVREYTIELPQETQGGKEPPAHWPLQNSGIHVENLVIRYAKDLQPALKGISFDVKPCERVAIVGRTGSGKSTLALSFFRFVEAYKGRIIIDGIDIASMPLHTLRSRLTIIPQDAALFSGTVRFNLDPFDQFSDADLYDVLRRTGLLNTRNASSQDDTAPCTPTGSVTGGDQVDSRTTKTSGVTSLDDHVQEGAKNFSAGQRQLLCLARGLLKLRESNVLVLDESTANLDHEADLLVQRAIREEIGDKSVTVLCIAHRLHTIIDFDRVLVLSQGEVVEYDTPSNLLSKGIEGSEFAKLCKETGEFDRLKEIADRKK